VFNDASAGKSAKGELAAKSPAGALKATKGKVAAAPEPAAIKKADADTAKGFHVTGRASDWEMYKGVLVFIDFYSDNLIT
jgi:hypothetical protein